MADILGKGLLGMGGFSQPMPNTALLGQFMDPTAMRNYQMKQMLLGAGLGLMSEPGMGGAARNAIAMGQNAGDSYMKNAMNAYQLQQAEEDRKLALEDRAFNRSRLQKQDAWANTERERQMQEWQRQDDLMAGRQKAVEGYMGDWQKQGGNLFDPSMQGWLRGQGVEGADPAMSQRVQTMQPYAAAGDYEGAFQQMTAQPEQIKPTDDMREYQFAVSQGYQGSFTQFQIDMKKAMATTVNLDGGMKLTEGQSKDINYYARGKYANADIDDDAMLNLAESLGGRLPGGNYLKSPEYRKAERAGREFLAVILRKDTGAAVTDSEMELYYPMYLPIPGDDAETIKAKKEARARAMNAIKLGSGTARPLFDEIDQRFTAENPPLPSNQSGQLNQPGNIYRPDFNSQETPSPAPAPDWGGESTPQQPPFPLLRDMEPSDGELLKMDPSDEAKRWFDSFYGEGAADYFLKGGQ